MSAHILIVADGRSPTAISWIKNVQALGYSVSLISTFPCQPLEGLQRFHILPIAFSHFSEGPSAGEVKAEKRSTKSLVRRFAPHLQKFRSILGPLTLLFYARKYRQLVDTIEPDLVHALRIPFEGMLASYTPNKIPCLAATWGNDLTLHARSSFLMRYFTRRCLKRVDGLTSDTHRDVRLARSLGLAPKTAVLVVPGSGGVDLAAINEAGSFDEKPFGLPKTGIWVVNPRGYRPGSVHQDVFFMSIPKIIAKHPNCVFICPNLDGYQQAEKLVKALNIEENTFLLPKLLQPQLWSLFKEAAIIVSPSSHDGTPNTLLEAMAAGCFPVVGDIESLREWIEPGDNGLQVDPLDPNALASAIISALDQPEMRQKAAAHNLVLIQNRAAQKTTRPRIDDFYRGFLS